jgi:putative transposase
MSAAARYTSVNTTAAFQLRYHFGWFTRGRQPLFEPVLVAAKINEHLPEIARRHEYHLLESEVSPRAVRSVLSLKPNHSPSRATAMVRGNLAKYLRQQLGLRNVWSRGIFVRSLGNVTSDVIRRYVSGQFAHHRAAPEHDPSRVQLARFHETRNASQLRAASHSVYEYNLHLVLVTERRAQFLDFEVAEALVRYWRRVCEKKQWIAWDIEVVTDHAHLFVGLRPKDDPEQVALSLMNNSEHFCRSRYSAAMYHANLTGLWCPSFYAGTVGAATTAQVKSFLARLKVNLPPRKRGGIRADGWATRLG